MSFRNPDRLKKAKNKVKKVVKKTKNVTGAVTEKKSK